VCLQALADILIAAEADKVLLSPSSSYSGMIMLFAKTEQLMLVTDRKDMGQAGTDADPHKEFTPVAKHCYRFMSRCGFMPRCVSSARGLFVHGGCVLCVHPHRHM
jgi:hypothetical protein